MRGIILWGFFWLLFIASVGYAGLTSSRSILDLENNANLIVIGSASGNFTVGPVERFTLQVSRVIKGDPTLTGSTISVDWTNAGSGISGIGTVAAIGTGLWFLQASSDGWLLLPVVQGNISFSTVFIPSSLNPILSVYAYDPASSLEDKLSSEISWAIENANGDYSYQVYLLQYGLLDQLHSSMIPILYQRMSVSSVAQQRILGLSGLIRRGSTSALISAAQGASTFNAYPTENGILLLSIRDYFRAADPTSIVALGQSAAGLTSPNLTFREAAAHALAAIHTAEVLPYLAMLLDDSDTNLRVEAIGGMGAFANGLPAQTSVGNPGLAHLQLPANAPYKTADTVANFAMGLQAIERNESLYLSFWKAWWMQNRGNLGY